MALRNQLLLVYYYSLLPPLPAVPIAGSRFCFQAIIAIIIFYIALIALHYLLFAIRRLLLLLFIIAAAIAATAARFISAAGICQPPLSIAAAMLCRCLPGASAAAAALFALTLSFIYYRQAAREYVSVRCVWPFSAGPLLLFVYAAAFFRFAFIIRLLRFSAALPLLAAAGRSGPAAAPCARWPGFRLTPLLRFDYCFHVSYLAAAINIAAQ